MERGAMDDRLNKTSNNFRLVLCMGASSGMVSSWRIAAYSAMNTLSWY